MNDAILVINGGSSSIKFALFADAALTRIAAGSIENINTAPHFRARDARGEEIADQRWDKAPAQAQLFEHLLHWIETRPGAVRLRAAGHRIVHGGPHHCKPVLLTDSVLRELRDSVPLAPLHQPHNLAPVAALAQLYPELPQIGCFDTAFHATNPRVSRLYALPYALSEAGIQRYGFHGLSYEYIAGELPRLDARAARGRTIVAHLGSGASVCALVNSVSVASSMGFSALDGLPMSTRSGAIDPGVLLYLLHEQHWEVEALIDLLYRQSGLLGLSGSSGDMRELLENDNPRARDAVDVFVYRSAREISSLISAAGGLDALVFTAGIGERAAPVRSRICAQLEWLGMRLDEEANQRGDARISSADSNVPVWVIPTDEEVMIARHTLRVITAA